MIARVRPVTAFALGLGAWVACALLGLAAIHGVTAPLDAAAARALFGRSPQLAHVLAASGYAPVLGAATLLAWGATRLARGAWWIAPAILGSQALSQAACEAVKAAFHRPRPAHWLAPHEAGFSFPSGHATTAVAFYGAWLAVVCASRLPPGLRIGLIVVLASWIVALDASRVALGAHYASDVLGGNLFGFGWDALAFGLVRVRGALRIDARKPREGT